MRRPTPTRVGDGTSESCGQAFGALRFCRRPGRARYVSIGTLGVYRMHSAQSNLAPIGQLHTAKKEGSAFREKVRMDRGEHRFLITVGKLNIARRDIDRVRPAPIGASLHRRSQIAPTNFDLLHVELTLMCTRRARSCNRVAKHADQALSSRSKAECFSRRDAWQIDCSSPTDPSADKRTKSPGHRAAARLTHLFGFTNCTGARSRPAIVLRITDARQLKLVVMFFYQLDVGWKSYGLRGFKRLVELS